MAPRHSDNGYSVIELIFIAALISVLAAMSVLQIEASRPGFQGDGAMRVVMGQMRTARELAISERRYMRVVLTTPNRVQVIREEVPGPTTSVVSSALLESGAQYVLVNGVPDTPDAFGRASAVHFGTATTIKFSPDGTLVNQDGVSINGTVFIALPPAATSARAVTVLGSTGRIRGYRWNGRVWRIV